MSDKPGVYYSISTYMYQARLAMYAHVQSKQVGLLTKGHVCVYIHKFHIFHSTNNSLGFNGLSCCSVKTAKVLKLAYVVPVGYGSYHHTWESAESPFFSWAIYIYEYK